MSGKNPRKVHWNLTKSAISFISTIFIFSTISIISTISIPAISIELRYNRRVDCDFSGCKIGNGKWEYCTPSLHGNLMCSMNGLIIYGG